MNGILAFSLTLPKASSENHFDVKSQVKLKLFFCNPFQFSSLLSNLNYNSDIHVPYIVIVLNQTYFIHCSTFFIQVFYFSFFHCVSSQMVVAEMNQLSCKGKVICSKSLRERSKNIEFYQSNLTRFPSSYEADVKPNNRLANKKRIDSG